MDRRRKINSIKVLASAVLLISVFVCFCACTETDETKETRSVNPDRTHRTDLWHRPGNTTETSDHTAVVTPVETETETTVTTEPTVPDIDSIKELYVYSVWYDAVIDNPADYESIDSDDAFALKGVFYFSSPLSIDLDAKLYKDGKVLLKRKLKLRENVTAEADFSAGLEGFGKFDSGEYYIELIYNGQVVGTTPNMRVR